MVAGRNVIDVLASFDPFLSAKSQHVKKIGRKTAEKQEVAVSVSLLEPPFNLRNGLQLFGRLHRLSLRKSLNSP
jgi:hypothetical protein